MATKKQYTKSELQAAIAETYAKGDALEQLFAAGEYLPDPVTVQVGDTVTAKFGRGAKQRDISGQVVAINGNQILVLDGFDTFKVFTKDATVTDAVELTATDSPPATIEVVEVAKPTPVEQTQPAASPEPEVLTEAQKLDALQRSVLTPKQYEDWVANRSGTQPVVQAAAAVKAELTPAPSDPLDI